MLAVGPARPGRRQPGTKKGRLWRASWISVVLLPKVGSTEIGTPQIGFEDSRVHTMWNVCAVSGNERGT
jgi:hypothetical protein